MIRTQRWNFEPLGCVPPTGPVQGGGWRQRRSSLGGGEVNYPSPQAHSTSPPKSSGIRWMQSPGVLIPRATPGVGGRGGRLCEGTRCTSGGDSFPFITQATPTTRLWSRWPFPCSTDEETKAQVLLSACPHRSGRRVLDRVAAGSPASTPLWEGSVLPLSRLSLRSGIRVGPVG